MDYRLRRHASGIDTIGRLRELAGRPIPALVITGDTAPDRLREAQESGHPLLHKPVMAGHLRAAMRRLMPGNGAAPVDSSGRKDAALLGDAPDLAGGKRSGAHDA